MKSFLRRGWNGFVFSLVIIAVVSVGRICLGAEDQSLVPSAATSVEAGLLSGVLGALTVKYGWLMALISWIGILRTVFKPVMTGIEKVIRETPSSKDDQILAEVEASSGYKFFCWALDFLASIKIGTQVTARASGASDPRNDGFVPAGARTNASGGSSADGGNVTLHPMVAIGLILFCALAGEACAVLDKAGTLVSRPVVSAVTNIVVEVRTNFVPVAVAVPGETRFVTNLVEHVTTNTIEHVTEHTNFVEKAGIETGMAGAKAGASLAPPPYNAIAAGVLAVVSGGLGFLVTRKNAQVKAANASNDVLKGSIDDLTDQNDSQAKQLQAVVKGVEQITTAINPEAGEKVKGIIADASKALGVSDDLHATVQALTTAPAAA